MFYMTGNKKAFQSLNIEIERPAGRSRAMKMHPKVSGNVLIFDKKTERFFDFAF